MVKSKKRAASANIERGPVKAPKRQDKIDKENEESLFDNLDEEMDPKELEHVLKQVDEDDDSIVDTFMDEIEDQNTEEEEEKDNNNDDDMPQKDKTSSERFRDLFMTKITQAFSTDLDQIRQEPGLDGPRLNVLIDSLESGIDIFSSIEKEIVLADEEKTSSSL
ncbi:hypothetical protein BCV72DRAFT_308347 [Rhizopus microsporus var. microsporus]|uniref:Ribosome assembly protein 3 n=2 Tax=Rhizopus microsporus TaxID=58291 RepID=A0A2G4SJD1_RHIZD|nr:uncharacterized protein RHIMIDRAFT_241098 [Rhizopus microsporus ATCC 52813]ORE03306.1 hypothetical protein BCV72DRAFT_308347 [Rhizopus microsporus var. microsporus]PHZ08878.1 hypothetical protein RHIMIDRAFT_241098 [Rhizopus microsporus ATCC 52813]